MPTENTSQNGFTIVELLIAALIISVGILAWAKTQEGGIKGRATSDSITTASELAMSLAEELALESKRLTPPILKNAPVTVRGVEFSRTGSVTAETVNGVGVRTVDIIVRWNQYGPKEVRYQRVTNGG